MKNTPFILLGAFILLAVSLQVSATSKNSFNLDEALIDVVTLNRTHSLK
ncbi:MAG: hypothetical protein Q8K59_04435 [Nitrosomonas sp.]|nr:hypothetical protein [Nitrosomonas sp.]MDP1950337.1 hypothetical protein [Nitrosomonas sp.]